MNILTSRFGRLNRRTITSNHSMTSFVLDREAIRLGHCSVKSCSGRYAFYYRVCVFSFLFPGFLECFRLILRLLRRITRRLSPALLIGNHPSFCGV